MKVRIISNVYTNVVDAEGRRAIDEIKSARPVINGHLAEWWYCGKAFVTQYDNGYYPVYVITKEPFYGKILREYYVNNKGKLVKDKHYYSVPTVQSLLDWCNEKHIKYI